VDPSAFRIVFNQTLNVQLRELEKRRHALLRLLAVLALAVSVMLWVALTTEIMALSLSLCLPIAALAYWGHWRARVFKNRFKPQIIPEILKTLNPAYRYYPGEYIAQDTFVRSGIFGTVPQWYRGEDYIKGRWGEWDFELSELVVRHPSLARGGMSVLFRGIFLHVATPLGYEGRALLIPQQEVNHLGRSIRAIARTGGQRRPGPDADFDAVFAFFVAPNSPCIHLFSPPQLRAIADFQRQTKHRLYLSYQNGHYYLALDQPKNLLEPSIFQSNIDFDRTYQFYRQLSMLTGLIQQMHLVEPLPPGPVS
jgi:hypothetical protein